MDRLDAMAVLVAVVDTGSLSAAGRKLGVPLPTVSRKLSDLEAYLETRLLTRSTRKLAPTEAGATYVAACKRILEQVRDAERAASSENVLPRGDLVVTAPIVFGRLHVLPVVNEFLAKFADINVRLVLSDRNVHLIDDHVDLAVRIGVLQDSSMMAMRIGSVRHVVCASPDYLARHGMPKAPDDLSVFPCVTFDALMSPVVWTFRDSPNQRLVPVHSRLSVNTAEAAIDAAIAGVGLTRVLSYQAAPAVAAGKLKIVLSGFEPDPLPINVVHLGQNLLPLKTRVLLDFLSMHMRQRATKVNLLAR